MQYDASTLEQAIVQQAVAATQAALLPQAFTQLGQAQQQLQAAQEQLKQAGEAIAAKNSHIEARNAENTALKTKAEELAAKLDHIVKLAGIPIEDLLGDFGQAPAAATDSEGGEAARRHELPRLPDRTQ